MDKITFWNERSRVKHEKAFKNFENMTSHYGFFIIFQFQKLNSFREIVLFGRTRITEWMLVFC